MMDYDGQGEWNTTGWWNPADCLTTMINYMLVSKDHTFSLWVNNILWKNIDKYKDDFCNDYLDDTAWWGLAWIAAYDMTSSSTYRYNAETTADYICIYSDNKCGGGIYWSTDKNYKNAITNELFIKLAAAIHNRTPGDTKYLNWALEVWNWFDNSGMINSQHLINDGLNETCENNGDITWTYNQGVILGALVELFYATREKVYADRAREIADTAVASSYLNPNGILHEPCDNNGNNCGADGPSFKRVFARNLGELNAILDDHPYSEYILNNAKKILENGNSLKQFGLDYEGPFEFHNAASHHSALGMLNAALKINSTFALNWKSCGN